MKKWNGLEASRWLIGALFGMVLVLMGCDDAAYLDKKQDQQMLVPTTLEDFRALLDNLPVMNALPSLSMIASDDHQTTATGYLSFTLASERNSYLWADEVHEGATSSDWNVPYQQVFYANIVLDGLEGVGRVAGNAREWDDVRGSALFYRAFAFYNLTQTFAAVYEPESAEALPGIPLRLSSDINLRVDRGSLQEAYDQVLADLTEAYELLPEEGEHSSRPGRVAVDALLARVYLSMGDYGAAQGAAERGLAVRSELYDFNTLTELRSNYWFPDDPTEYNEEQLYYFVNINYSFFRRSFLSTELYALYEEHDLRREIFFLENSDGTHRFLSYRGLSVPELMLVRAECLVRLGEVPEGLEVLNALLKHRYVTGTFEPLVAGDEREALTLVLEERRKELVQRGVRWSDLRRLNLDPRFAKELTREVDYGTLTLPPNDLRYVFPIPPDEIGLSGIAQNPR